MHSTELEMLERLDDIKWNKLTHAYGPADDVPDQIRALNSISPKKRNQAIRSLYGNIFHQGTRYQATPYVVPFLYELLASEEVLGRESLLFLLVNIALGYEEYYLARGLNMLDIRKEVADSLANMTEEDRAECKTFGFGPQVEIDCYDSVKKGIPLLRSLAKHQETKVRRAAIYALAWFPEEAEKSIPLLLKQLKTYPQISDKANTIIAIGFLAKSAQKEFDLSFLLPYLTDKATFVRAAAAIALARPPLSNEILEVLIQSLVQSKKIEEEEHLYFNESNLTGHISLVLSFNSADVDKIVPALCKALETVNAYGSLDVTTALLTIIYNERKTLYKDVKLEALSDLEKQALTAILHHGGWMIGESIFSNYSQLLRGYGIPNRKKDLQAYLQQ